MQVLVRNAQLLHGNVGYGSTEDSTDGEVISVSFEDEENTTSIHYMKKDGLPNSIRESLRHSIDKFQQSMVPFPASVRDMGGSSTMANEMFNLVKNLIGAGAFGIPSGFANLAGASQSKRVMVPAGWIIFLMAIIFVYYFVLIARLCQMTGAASYREAWDKSAGARSEIWRKISFLVPLSVILMAGLGNLAYSMILADTTRSLMERLGFDITRTASLLIITTFVLLPLCMVKKLSLLAPFSAVGTGGIIFTLMVMALRCFDGSYDSDKGGRFLDVSP